MKILRIGCTVTEIAVLGMLRGSDNKVTEKNTTLNPNKVTKAKYHTLHIES